MRYERLALPVQLRHLGACDSIADREERRACMAADPDRQEFLKGNESTFAAQENKILKPARFSPS